MKKEDIIKEFYNYLEEFEGGLTNLIYKLGDEYKDVKQEVLIRLIRHSECYEINSKLKGLMFIILRNESIRALKKKENRVNEYDLNSIPADIIPIIGLSEEDEKLKQILLNYISKEDYQQLTNYYDNLYTKHNTKQDEIKARCIKKKLGFSKEFQIKNITTGEQRVFKSLKEVSKWIGGDNAYLTKKYKEKLFKYDGHTYRIKIITKLKKIPGFSN